jgi:tetratricopeptide (TPR) repeat protein
MRTLKAGFSNYATHSKQPKALARLVYWFFNGAIVCNQFGLRKKQALKIIRRSILLILGAAVLGLMGLMGWWHYHFSLAEKAMNSCRCALAQEHLNRCFTVWSKSASAHLLAARAARISGQLDQAQEHVIAAEKSGGVSHNTALERSLQKVQRGEGSKEESFLIELLKKKDPQSILILEALAQGYLSSHRQGEAQSCLNQLLRQQPNHSKALLWRGMIAVETGKYDEALADYEKSVQLSPEDDEARLNLVELLMQAGRGPEAIYHADVVRRRQPGSAEALVALAHCRFYQHEVEEARAVLDGLLLEQPQCVPALIERSLVAFHQGSLDLANNWAHQAAKRAPRDQEALAMLCLCLKTLKKDQEAAQWQKQLDELEINRQRIAQLTNQLNDAPNDLSIRYNLGQEFLKDGQTDQARSLFLSILEKDSHHQGAAKAMGELSKRP